MAGQRRTGTAAVAGALALALGLGGGALAVAGCGNGAAGGDGADGRTPGTRGGVVGAFCEAYAGYHQEFSGGASYDEVLTALRDLEPPPEVADDFAALTGAVESMATVDTSDPGAVARFQETTSAEARAANANIVDYVVAECPGFDAPAGIVPSTSGG